MLKSQEGNARSVSLPAVVRVSIKTGMSVTTYVLLLTNVYSTLFNSVQHQKSYTYVRYFIIDRPSSLFYVSSTEFHRLNVKRGPAGYRVSLIVFTCVENSNE